MASEEKYDLREDEEQDDLDENDIEVMSDSDGLTGVLGFAAGLGFGALLGAGVALLLAPARGDITRRRIRRRLQDLQDDAVHHFDDVRGEARREVTRQRRKMRRKLSRN